MDTALYYTFSTIAQTLAAALGLSAAVVLFALDKLGRQIDVVARELLGKVSPNDTDGMERLGMYLRGDYRALRAAFEGWRQASGSSFGDEKSRELDILKAHLDSDADVRKRFSTAGVTSATVVLGSIGALPVTPAIAETELLAGVVLLVGWMGAAVCIVLYWRLLAATIASAGKVSAR